MAMMGSAATIKDKFKALLHDTQADGSRRLRLHVTDIKVNFLATIGDVTLLVGSRYSLVKAYNVRSFHHGVLVTD